MFCLSVSFEKYLGSLKLNKSMIVEEIGIVVLCRKAKWKINFICRKCLKIIFTVENSKRKFILIRTQRILFIRYIIFVNFVCVVQTVSYCFLCVWIKDLHYCTIYISFVGKGIMLTLTLRITNIIFNPRNTHEFSKYK